MRHSFHNSLPSVLPFLLDVMSHHSNSSSEATLQACKCVQAWVQFGLPLDQCDPIVDRLLQVSMVLLPLLLFQCVGDEELQDTVIEALSSLVSHPDTHKYPSKLMEVSNLCFRTSCSLSPRS